MQFDTSVDSSNWRQTLALLLRISSATWSITSQDITLTRTGVRGGGAGGATPPPKVLIWWKSGQNLWQSSKTLWKSEQKWRPTCLDLKIMAPELTWKAFEVTWRPNWHEEFFCGGHLFWSIFRTSLGESGQIPSHPQKFACSYIYTCMTTYCIQCRIYL